jgi:outer membrane lipoprotein-sorting protein
MKCVNALLFSLGIASLALPARAQTPDEIINKYIAATGGKDVLNQIKTVYTEEDMTIMGNPAPSLTYVVDGKGYKNLVTFNGQQIVTCYTDTAGWTINPLMGQATAAAVPADQLKIGQFQLDVKGPLFDYAAKGNKVVLAGVEDLDGARVYKLKLTTSGNTGITLLIDSSTYYLVKTVIKLSIGGQDVEIAAALSNYQKTPFGWVVPFTREVSYPGLTVSSTVKKIAINQEIDPAIFAMPKK